MAVAAQAGARVRAARERLGLRQAELARRAGISAAYLNLIEHDRRRIGADLLARIGAVLGVEPESLAEAGVSARVEDMRLAAAAMPQAGAEADRAEDLAGRYPGWAALVQAQARRIGQLDRLVEALADRIGQDTHLSQALHEVLSAAASVRSTAAILAEGEDIAPEWRRRFHANLHEDSERLVAGAEALVAYLDAGEAAAAGVAAAPLEELEDWLAARGWHLPELEPGGPGPAALADGIARMASGAARRLAADWVNEAARDAARMPAAAYRAALAEAGGDPLRAGARFGAGGVAAMRRVAMLPGAAEGLVICDASGAILIRKGMAGFPMPRGGGACPLWPLYAALGRPMQPVEALGEVPGLIPRRFRLRAYCEAWHPDGFGGAELRRAAMLISPEGGEGGVLRLGGACRVCPRDGCAARREPSILSTAAAASAAARAGLG
ncbi:MAG: helix-turn-helix domain-containing protein [Paracoccaceae bacterium]|nr:MAG: helix-turn-helix domain-containing protein [Paracoccaceae bacterium]